MFIAMVKVKIAFNMWNIVFILPAKLYIFYTIFQIINIKCKMTDFNSHVGRYFIALIIDIDL